MSTTLPDPARWEDISMSPHRTSIAPEVPPAEGAAAPSDAPGKRAVWPKRIIVAALAAALLGAWGWDFSRRARHVTELAVCYDDASGTEVTGRRVSLFPEPVQDLFPWDGLGPWWFARDGVEYTGRLQTYSDFEERMACG